MKKDGIDKGGIEEKEKGEEKEKEESPHSIVRIMRSDGEDGREKMKLEESNASIGFYLFVFCFNFNHRPVSYST